ncbi:Polysaccharide Lyase Family 14 protein [Trametes cinnabarina]|uniref:Polysaccharide Lyase Family 14 protein n=1 Tax=Pycnoporus cinnabarinus TaxID=5643 RepID=A0A060SA41_PYCCI|nr:Polysaccharide Lyase Family 14 protein [Trametes cinnabarina]
MLSAAFTVFTLLATIAPSWSQQIADPPTLASLYSLTTSTSIPFPTATLSNSDAQSFIVSGWSLSKGKIQQGASNIAFVADPFPNKPAPTSTTNSTGPVLQVTYPAGQFGSETSGLQLYSLWNTSDNSGFQSMLVTYEVAFDSDFNFVKGGKLPGLRGGPDPDGCSGGSAANGSNCFSTRLMWRKEAAGEVYAYIPTPNNMCSNSNFKCNDDGFGTSIDRGSFSFAAGQWNRVSLIVRLNQPLTTANGEVVLYYNNVKALDEQILQYRSSSDITIGGLWLSTFFGGGDSSWAPSSDVHAYFRNFELFGSSAPSNLTGQQVSAASRHTNIVFSTSAWGAAAVALAVAALGSLL